MCRYYKALTVMETRFPISKDRTHVMISFTWYDAFRASKRTEQYSIHFEKAAIMFNLGAVLTQQALACDRTQDQGMKDAARKFQVGPVHSILLCSRAACDTVDTSAEQEAVSLNLMIASWYCRSVHCPHNQH